MKLSSETSETCLQRQVLTCHTRFRWKCMEMEHQLQHERALGFKQCWAFQPWYLDVAQHWTLVFCHRPKCKYTTFENTLRPVCVVLVGCGVTCNCYTKRLSIWSNCMTVDTSYTRIDTWLAWSFWWLGQGVHPDQDPFGRRFDESYWPQRAQISGTRIAGKWRCFLSGHRGDWQYLASFSVLSKLAETHISQVSSCGTAQSEHVAHFT